MAKKTIRNILTVVLISLGSFALYQFLDALVEKGFTRLSNLWNAPWLADPLAITGLTVLIVIALVVLVLRTKTAKKGLLDLLTT